MYYRIRDNTLIPHMTCTPAGIPHRFLYRERLHRVEQAVSLDRRIFRNRQYWRLFTTTGLKLEIYQDRACDEWHLERLYY